MRLCDLQEKEVINQNTCKRLGYVNDVEIDMNSGCLKAIIVPGEAKICGMFGRDSEYIIPYKCICQIGKEIILVNVCESEVLKKCPVC